MLNALPKSQHARAKAVLPAIWMAATREEACRAFDRLIAGFAAKYPKAVEKLVKDKESLLALYDFPLNTGSTSARRMRSNRLLRPCAIAQRAPETASRARLSWA